MGSSCGDFGRSRGAWYGEEPEDFDNGVEGESEVSWTSAAAPIDAQSSSVVPMEAIVKAEGRAEVRVLEDYMDNKDDVD